MVWPVRNHLLCPLFHRPGLTDVKQRKQKRLYILAVWVCHLQKLHNNIFVNFCSASCMKNNDSPWKTYSRGSSAMYLAPPLISFLMIITFVQFVGRFRDRQPHSHEFSVGICPRNLECMTGTLYPLWCFKSFNILYADTSSKPMLGSITGLETNGSQLVTD